MTTNALAVFLGVLGACMGSGGPQRSSLRDGESQAGSQISGAMVSAITAVAREIRRPIGLVEDSYQTAPCVVNAVVVNPRKPENALDAIAGRCPAYTWKKEGNSIFFLPKRSVPSAVDITVRSFSIRDATAAEAQRSVMALLELRRWMVDNNVRSFDLESPSSQRQAVARISLDLRDVRLREILDGIAQASGRMLWRVVWFDQDRYMGIYF